MGNCIISKSINKENKGKFEMVLHSVIDQINFGKVMFNCLAI